MRSTLRTESTHVRVCEFALSSDVVGEDSEDGEGAGGGDGGGGEGGGEGGGGDAGGREGGGLGGGGEGGGGEGGGLGGGGERGGGEGGGEGGGGEGDAALWTVTVGGEIDVASIIRAYSKVCAMELMVSTVRSVKFFRIKAVEYGVVVVALTRKVSATVVEASHASITPSGRPGKVAAKRSAIVERKKLFWSLSSRSWFVPVMVPLTLSPPTVSRSESKPGGEVIHSTETVAL